MAIQYFYSEPDNVLCVKIKVPVVLAEEEVQVIVDNVATLPELAQKVDHIDARLDDFKARPVFLHENGDRWISVIEQEGWERFGWRWSEHRQPVVKKVLVEGILHKQIYFVNKNDFVVHVGEDIPFANDVTLADPAPVVDEDNVFVQLHNKKIDMRWDLRRGSRLQQTGIMIFQVKVVEERQIFVQVCPQLDRKCARGINLLKDGSFNAWGTNNTPIFWGADNVVQVNGGAELGGSVANEQASLFQSVRENIIPTAQYRLCFDAKEVPEGELGVASFSLIVEVAYYDRFGNFINSDQQTFTPTQIPDDTFTRLCINTSAPEDAREAVVRFTFVPTNVNTSTVVIDNVMLECLRIQNQFFETHR